VIPEPRKRARRLAPVSAAGSPKSWFAEGRFASRAGADPSPSSRLLEGRQTAAGRNERRPAARGWCRARQRFPVCESFFSGTARCGAGSCGPPRQMPSRSKPRAIRCPGNASRPRRHRTVPPARHHPAVPSRFHITHRRNVGASSPRSRGQMIEPSNNRRRGGRSLAGLVPSPSSSKRILSRVEEGGAGRSPLERLSRARSSARRFARLSGMIDPQSRTGHGEVVVEGSRQQASPWACSAKREVLHWWRGRPRRCLPFHYRLSPTWEIKKAVFVRPGPTATSSSTTCGWAESGRRRVSCPFSPASTRGEQVVVFRRSQLLQIDSRSSRRWARNSARHHRPNGACATGSRSIAASVLLVFGGHLRRAANLPIDAYPDVTDVSKCRSSPPRLRSLGRWRWSST